MGIRIRLRRAAVLGGACAVLALALARPADAQTFTIAPGTTQTDAAQIGGAANTVTVTGGGTLVLTNPANSYGGGTVVNDSSTLQVGVDGDLGAAAGGVTLGDGALQGVLDLSTTTTAVTSARPFTLNAGSGQIITGTGGTWTLTGSMGGTGELVVSGSGNLILSGANTYTGGTVVVGGTLTVSSDANLGNGGTVGLAPGTTLSFAAGGAYSHALVLDGDPTLNVAPGQTATYNGQITDGFFLGTLNVTGGGTLALTNATNSYSGGTFVTGGSTLAVGADGALGNAAAALNLGNGATTATLDLTSTAAAVASARNINIGSAGATIVAGNNPWTLNGVVSGGALTVSGGDLILNNTGNAFTNLTVIGNGTVGAAADSVLGIGAVTLGNATTSGLIDFTSATVPFVSGRAYTINAGGAAFLVGAAAPVNISGIISGTGGLAVRGGGSLILTGVNTYTGFTQVTGGSTVAVSIDANLGGNTTGSVFLGDATSNGTLGISGIATTNRSIILGAGGGTINALGVWTFDQPVTGPGALTVTGNSGGNVVFDAVNSYAGGTTITGGTLMVGDASSPGASIPGNVTLTGGTLAGYGSIPGTVTNTSGTVSPGGSGSVGSLTVGNFTQGAHGITSIQITPAGASTLNVTGAANLAGTLNLAFQGNFHTETLDLINAGTFNGTTFTTVTGALSSAIAQQIVYTPNEIELILTQLGLPQNPSIYPAITTVAVDEAQGDSDMILGRLTDLRTEAVVDDMEMADSTSHRAGLSSGKSPYGPWFKALGGYGSATGNAVAPGYSTRGGGFITGMDFQLHNGVVGGIAFSYGIDRLSESGGAKADLDIPRLLVYGGWWHGPLVLDGMLGVGYANIDSSRPFAATGTTATATFTGTQVTSAFQAATPMHVGPVVLTPAVGFDYALVNQDIANETGAGVNNLSVLASSTNSLRPFIAATVATRFDLGNHAAIEPQFRVAYEEELLGVSHAAQVQPVGDAQVFTVPGLTPSRGTVRASAGVKVETDRNLAFFANFEGTDAGNAHSLGADAGVRYRF